MPRQVAEQMNAKHALRGARAHASWCGVMLVAALWAAVPLSAQTVRLPRGDGHVTTHPATGNVYACRERFRAGGARHAGSWIEGDTWNPAAKPHVAGHVLWPDAAFTLEPDRDALDFTGDGLPVGQPTGRFPIAPTDPAYRYDTNPNRIAAQDLAFQIPAHPVAAGEPQCLPMGMIGFTTTGVAIYSALDDAGRDAAAHEIQDACDGHPQANSQYHYHSASPCLPGAAGNELVGWALDGYPIFGMRDNDGDLLTNADLDACHGRAERHEISGRAYDYAYRLTREYPYTLGCFTGRLRADTLDAVRDGLLPPRGPGRRGRMGGG
jgi:hypothetical protein